MTAAAMDIFEEDLYSGDGYDFNWLVDQVARQLGSPQRSFGSRKIAQNR
jgi:hypothetical protein